MSTSWFELTDAKDPAWKLEIETSCNGMKLWINDGKQGAKFWFGSRADVEKLRDALDWIGDYHFREPSPPRPIANVRTA